MLGVFPDLEGAGPARQAGESHRIVPIEQHLDVVFLVVDPDRDRRRGRIDWFRERERELVDQEAVLDFSLNPPISVRATGSPSILRCVK
jgi:hypothetical protein